MRGSSGFDSPCRSYFAFCTLILTAESEFYFYYFLVASIGDKSGMYSSVVNENSERCAYATGDALSASAPIYLCLRDRIRLPFCTAGPRLRPKLIQSG